MTRLIQCVVWLVICLAAAPARAQFETGAVLGTVRDNSGAVVPGATVTLLNTQTGVAVVRTTDPEGGYEFFTVRPGVYKVTAELSGFATAFADNVQVSVGGRQRVELTMKVGDLTEAVEVVGGARTLDTDTSQRGQVVSGKQAAELPLNGREYSSLAQLSPGVRLSALNTGGLTPREGSFNVNGLRSTFNNFLIDGVDNNAYGTSNQGFSNQVMQPPPDALAEFRVVTNNMSAEYGRSGGATINVAYKSGTNRFSGAALGVLPGYVDERRGLLQVTGRQARVEAQSVRVRRRRADPAQPRLLLHRLRGLPAGPRGRDASRRSPPRRSVRASSPWTCATRSLATPTLPARPFR